MTDHLRNIDLIISYLQWLLESHTSECLIKTKKVRLKNGDYQIDIQNTMILSQSFAFQKDYIFTKRDDSCLAFNIPC